MALALPGIGFRRKVARGYQRSQAVVSFNHDGLEVARVKSTKRWLPVWHIIFFVYLALLIRLVVMADMGPSGYAQRINQLKEGNVLERMAATVMEMDPVSQALAGKIRNALGVVNERILARDV